MARLDKQADTAYKNQYQKDNYDRISILLPKGTKERLKEHLGDIGINSYINNLIQKELEGN